MSAIASIPRPSASLYVGTLNPDVTEANLFEIFNLVGPVASIRVCRDTITRRSLGYAYVNFHNLVDAERALDTLNYTPIRGRACRIMWSQRDPSLRKSGLGNIFIKNLDKAIDNKSLHDTFSAFGNILSCRVMTDETGSSRGFGFVHFENDESAESAIKSVNGMLLNEKQVYVGLHIPRKERISKYDEMKKHFTNVFVKNLHESLSDDQFQNMFTPFGQITSAVVMRDEQGKSKGFGFVNFITHEEAAKACDELNEQEVNGKKLYVGRAQKKTERKDELQRKYEAQRQERYNKYQAVNLYVKNLDDTVTDEKLRQEFAQFGTITSAKIQTDDKGNSRGFGFVCFSAPEEATKAVTEANGRMMGSKPIYVALAQRKEVRRQQLESLYAQRAQMRAAQQAGVLGNPYAQPPIFYGIGVPQPRGGQGMVYGPMMPRATRYIPQAQQPIPQGQEMMGAYPGGNTVRPNQRGGGGGPRSSRPMQTTPQRVGVNGGIPPNQPNAVPNQPRGPNTNAQAAPHAGGNQNKGYKLNANVRNRVDQAMPQMQPQPAVTYNPQEPLTASVLAGASAEDQKQMLGERLYPLVYERQGESLAGKITGMLLDMDNAELLILLENPEALTTKIDEALAVLEAHEPSSK
jgi:polyadenylate-binding protein